MLRGYLSVILLSAIWAGYQANSSAQGPVIFQPSQVRELEQGDGNHSGRKVGFSLDKFTKSPSQAGKNNSPPAHEIWSQFFTGKRDTLAMDSPNRYRFSLGIMTKTPTERVALTANQQLPQGIAQQRYRNVSPERAPYEQGIVYVPVYAVPSQPDQGITTDTNGGTGQFNDHSAVVMVPLQSVPSPSGNSHTNRNELTTMSETVQVPRDRVRLVSGSVPTTEIPVVTPLPSNHPPKVYRPQ